VAICLLAVLGTANASFAEDKAAYEDCVLQHVSLAENGTAANLMTNACHRLYIDNFMLSEKDQSYFQCLLEYLPPSKSTPVAMRIKSTCNSKHRSLFN
ncbi:VF_A0006 family four-cysteine protein, partial [Photobacterium sanctipauli]